jgi:mevalonate kinase
MVMPEQEQNPVFVTKSHGKVLISGEYFLLKGAKGLAFPVKFSQSLIVSKREVNSRTFKMESYYAEKKWFSAEFICNDFSVIRCWNVGRARYLSSLFRAIRLLNPLFQNSEVYNIDCILDFDPDWGLGSSSTLIVNLCNWAGIDPFKVHFLISKGSGYDIAVAMLNQPIIYRINASDRVPEISILATKYSFSDKLYFVYLGKKVSSEISLNKFNAFNNVDEGLVSDISELTDEIVITNNFSEFNTILIKLINLSKKVIEADQVLVNLWKDFPGVIKPLGAWGGDFALVTWGGSVDELRKYFYQKEHFTLFAWKDFILYN